MKDLRGLKDDAEFQNELKDFVKKNFCKETKELIKKYKEPGFPNEENFKAIWKNLKKIFWKKQNKCCCICEKRLSDIYSIDIDHYRPKTIYWWLAHNPKNYYLTCAECNRSNKRAQFPLYRDHLPTKYAERKILEEKPLLLNPMYDNHVEYFELTFIIHSQTNERIAILKPKKGLNEELLARAEKTIEVFNLDLNKYNDTDFTRLDLMIEYYDLLIDIAKAKNEYVEKGEFYKFLKQKLEERKELKTLGLLQLIIQNKRIEINTIE